MKKIMIILSICLISFLPSIVNAETRAQNLIDTLKAAGITPSVEEQVETDDMVTIYFFWSNECNHCHDELEFINDHLEEYSTKFKMRSFECNSNDDNYQLEQRIAKYMKIKAPGFPLMVVGNKTHYGYDEEVGETILNDIDALFKETEKYDVFEEMEKYPDGRPGDNLSIIFWSSIVATVILFIIIIVIVIKKVCKK